MRRNQRRPVDLTALMFVSMNILPSVVRIVYNDVNCAMFLRCTIYCIQMPIPDCVQSESFRVQKIKRKTDVEYTQFHSQTAGIGI